MNKDKFKQRGFQETLERICRAKGEPFYKHGRVAQTFIARKISVKQSTVSRWLSFSSKNIDKDNIAGLAKLLGVTPAQLRGEEPIEMLDGAGKSPEDLQFIQRFNSHPGELKKALQVYEQVWLQSNQKSE